MKTISYTITDELGLHGRPAGKIVKMAKEFPGKVEIGTESNMVNCKRIMGIMGLALKQGDTITMSFEGEGEDDMADKVLAFMNAEL